MPEKRASKETLVAEPLPAIELTTDGDIDLSLLKDSLAMTPWERMQANDDALNFAASLREAMKKRNAKSL